MMNEGYASILLEKEGCQYCSSAWGLRLFHTCVTMSRRQVLFEHAHGISQFSPKVSSICIKKSGNPFDDASEYFFHAEDR